MEEFLKYEKMITPVILKVLSYILMLLVVVSALMSMIAAPGISILMILFGPVGIRIYTELLLVIFEIHTEVKKITDNK